MKKWIGNLVLSFIIYGVILFFVDRYLPGFFRVESTQYGIILTFGFLAILFWVINTIVKFILNLLTLPLKYMTFGLFSLVLNMLMLYIFEYVVNYMGLGVIVHLSPHIWQVFLLSLIISVVAFLLKKAL